VLCKPHQRVDCADPICRRARRWQATHAPKTPAVTAAARPRRADPQPAAVQTPVFVAPDQP
jgi:hypothetical protein